MTEQVPEVPATPQERVAAIAHKVAATPGNYRANKLDVYACLAEIERLTRENAHLRLRSVRLGRLEAAGVDNWEGFSSAFEDGDDDDA